MTEITTITRHIPAKTAPSWVDLSKPRNQAKYAAKDVEITVLVGTVARAYPGANHSTVVEFDDGVTAHEFSGQTLRVADHVLDSLAGRTVRIESKEARDQVDIIRTIDEHQKRDNVYLIDDIELVDTADTQL